MAQVIRATKALEQAGIAFELRSYDYDPDAESIGQAAALALGVETAQVFKTLMVLADGKPACAIAPSDGEVSMKRVAVALGAKAAAMMKPADAERISGYKIGGVSPFGQTPIGFGDISVPGGGLMSGHVGHQAGHEVDVRPFRTDGRNAQTTWRSASYDSDATREFVQTVKQSHPGSTVLFNDPALIREGLVKRFDGHDNHLHVRFGSGAGTPARRSR